MVKDINLIEFMEYLENLKHHYIEESKNSTHYVLIINNCAKVEVIKEIENKIKEVYKIK